jgi:hypothetical protein
LPTGNSSNEAGVPNDIPTSPSQNPTAGGTVNTQTATVEQTVTQKQETPQGTVEQTTTTTSEIFNPKNIPAFIPRLNWKEKLLAMLPAGGFGFSTIFAYAAKMPDWLIFLLGVLTGIALWNFFQFIIKHREKVLEFITECYKKTADPTQHNLIPTPTPDNYVGERRSLLTQALSEKKL